MAHPLEEERDTRRIDSDSLREKARRVVMSVLCVIMPHGFLQEPACDPSPTNYIEAHVFVNGTEVVPNSLSVPVQDSRNPYDENQRTQPFVADLPQETVKPKRTSGLSTKIDTGKPRH